MRRPHRLSVIAPMAALILAAASPAWGQARRGRTQEPAASSLGSPREDLPPGGSAAADGTSEGDLALLRAVGFMFEPAPREIRVLAVEDTALLGDPRALNPLAHMVFDPDPQVATTAVRAIGRFRHPRAEEILSNVVRHPTLPVALKVAAVRGLPFQDTPGSRELLTDLSTSDRYSPQVRQAAVTALREMAGVTASRPGAQK